MKPALFIALVFVPIILPFALLGFVTQAVLDGFRTGRTAYDRAANSVVDAAIWKTEITREE